MITAMKNILAKLLLTAALIILFNPVPTEAETEDLINFDLSFAGYRLGMTYDDVLLIRPVDFIQDTGSDQFDSADLYFDATAKNIYVHDIEMDLWLRFKNERLFKVIARFTPDKTDELIGIFNQALGPGEDRSRSLPVHEGGEMRQTIYYWDYPGAKLHLVKVSSNHDYATVGLTIKPGYAKTFTEEID